jgi:osmotically-inducible protein OsmY
MPRERSTREAPEGACPDVYVAEALRSALARDPRVHELGLTVRLVAGKVFLAGVVACAERRDCIAAVARELLPDLDIHNELSVEPMSPPERETLA